MINLNHVKTFLVVAGCGGIRAGASQLQISASTVLAHIRQLEEELAVPLLVRQRGPLTLSRHGLQFMPLARALVATAERARHLLHDSPLRLATSSNIGTYILQSSLSRFRHDTGIEIDLSIGSNPEVADRLERGDADAGMMEWWDDRPGFVARFWRREHLVVIVPPSHRWARRRSVTTDALAREPMLGGETGTGTGTVLRQALGPGAAKLTTVGGYGNTEAVKRAVRAGIGISIVMAAAVVDEVMAGHLVALPVKDIELSKDMFIVLPAGAPANAPASILSDHLVAP